MTRDSICSTPVQNKNVLNLCFFCFLSSLPGRPTNDTGNNCAYMNGRSGRWDDFPCDFYGSTFYYICSLPSTGAMCFMYSSNVWLAMCS